MLSQPSDPGDPGDMPLTPPEAPRSYKRHVGFFVAALLLAALGAAAWHFKTSAPPRESAPTVLPRP